MSSVSVRGFIAIAIAITITIIITITITIAIAITITITITIASSTITCTITITISIAIAIASSTIACTITCTSTSISTLTISTPSTSSNSTTSTSTLTPVPSTAPNTTATTTPYMVLRIWPVAPDNNTNDGKDVFIGPSSAASSMAFDDDASEKSFRSIGPIRLTQISSSQFWQRSLHLVGIAWVGAGISFIITVILCIVFTLSYAGFVSDGVDYLVVYACAYHSYLLVRWSISVVRTSARLLVLMWAFKLTEALHLNKAVFIIHMVDKIARAMARLSLLMPFSKDQVELPYLQTTIENRSHYVWAVFKALPLAAFATPVIVFSSLYGQDAVIGKLAIIFTQSSAVILIVINVWIRLRRCANFMHIFSQNISQARIRAIFVTTVGEAQMSKNALSDVCRAAILIFIYILLSFFIFSSSTPTTIESVCCCVVIGIILLIQFRSHIYDIYQWLYTGTTTLISHRYPLNTSNHSRFYNGHSRTPVWGIFIVKHIWTILGLISLVYSDIKGTATHSDARKPMTKSLFPPNIGHTHTLEVITIILYVIIAGRDLALLLIRKPMIRACVLSILVLMQIVLTGLMATYFNGMTGLAVIFATILTIDYRDGRFFWTDNFPKSSSISNIIEPPKTSLKPLDPTIPVVDIALQKRTKKERTITAATMLIAIAAVLIISMAVEFTSKAEDDSAKTLPDPNVLAKLAMTRNPARAPMCQMSLHPDLPLGLVDYCALSAAIRLSNETSVYTIINSSATLIDYKIARSNFSDNTGVRFFDFKNSITNTSIIVISDTNKLEDIVQDVYIWATPTLLQISSYFGTYVNLWNEEDIAYVVYIINCYAAYINLSYHLEVEQYVQSILPDRQRVVLVGHSLGGGIAQIIGARLKLPSLGFSSPGLGLMRKHFNITVEDLNRYTYNVVPRFDLIPKIDLQQGTLINIPCQRQTALACHRIKTTLKTLLELC